MTLEQKPRSCSLPEVTKPAHGATLDLNTRPFLSQSQCSEPLELPPIRLLSHIGAPEEISFTDTVHKDVYDKIIREYMLAEKSLLIASSASSLAGACTCPYIPMCVYRETKTCRLTHTLSCHYSCIFILLFLGDLSFVIEGLLQIKPRCHP